jgi:hypothetical protein
MQNRKFMLLISMDLLYLLDRRVKILTSNRSRAIPEELYVLNIPQILYATTAV